jgi:hypothetical protein
LNYKPGAADPKLSLHASELKVKNQQIQALKLRFIAKNIELFLTTPKTTLLR